MVATTEDYDGPRANRRDGKLKSTKKECSNGAGLCCRRECEVRESREEAWEGGRSVGGGGGEGEGGLFKPGT